MGRSDGTVLCEVYNSEAKRADVEPRFHDILDFALQALSIARRSWEETGGSVDVQDPLLSCSCRLDVLDGHG